MQKRECGAQSWAEERLSGCRGGSSAMVLLAGTQRGRGAHTAEERWEAGPVRGPSSCPLCPLSSPSSGPYCTALYLLRDVFRAWKDQCAFPFMTYRSLTQPRWTNHVHPCQAPEPWGHFTGTLPIYNSVARGARPLLDSLSRTKTSLQPLWPASWSRTWPFRDGCAEGESFGWFLEAPDCCLREWGYQNWLVGRFFCWQGD